MSGLIWYKLYLSSPPYALSSLPGVAIEIKEITSVTLYIPVDCSLSSLSGASLIHTLPSVNIVHVPPNRYNYPIKHAIVPHLRRGHGSGGQAKSVAFTPC
ncbi:hypothetical protein BaRGS_00009607 [Batillaria attramentaria]|uniref:Uncharacterized protein n=1 Tax=Batillaria attramentaria TaxID=370345 RepID=A0ABD0LI22_9CAEN